MIQKLRDSTLMALVTNCVSPGIERRDLAEDMLHERDMDANAITLTAPNDLAPTAPVSNVAAP